MSSTEASLDMDAEQKIAGKSSARMPAVTLKDLPKPAVPLWKQALRNIKRNSHLILAELTIGFPFIGYKMLASILLENMGNSVANVLSALLLTLAVVDFVFNMFNLVALIFVGHRLGPVCFLSWVCKHTPLMRRFNDIGEALDTMISFTIVAIVVGMNLFPNLIELSPGGADGPKFFFKLWNICTVANVLGAGFGRLQNSFRHAKVVTRMGTKA